MVRNFNFNLKKLKRKGNKQYKINLGIFEKALYINVKKTIKFKKALIKCTKTHLLAAVKFLIKLTSKKLKNLSYHLILHGPSLQQKNQIDHKTLIETAIFEN